MATIIGTNFNDNGTTQNGVFYPRLEGTVASDTIYGLAGNDVLGSYSTANTGEDTMYGGANNDFYYVNSTGDTVVEYANEGTDSVSSSVSYSLTANVENLYLSGTAYSGYGNSLNNIIYGTSSSNYLSGGAGNDTMYGFGGNDYYVIDSLADVVTEYVSQGTDTVYSNVSGYTLTANVENLSLLGTVYSGYGNSLNNIIYGNSSANYLNGGAGNDTMYGFGGNDYYVIDSLADVVTEYVSQGTDTVYSNVSGYTLTANVENLSLLGTVYSGYGNSLNNIIYGNSSANYLNGGAGNDTMYGYGGNDYYVIDSLGDVVTEYASQGTDTVYSSVSGYTLTANVENLSLLGTVYSGYGNSLNNIIYGNSSANYLNGGAGNDTMYGYGGNDYYVIDSLGDVVTEYASQGTDTVYSSVSGYTLTANVENLSLGGTVYSGYGNSLNNIIYGNSSANYLNGGAGNDTMYGYGGNDYYVVDTVSDVVTEYASQGTDTVYSYASGYTLTANVENLSLFGTVYSGYGNSLNNTIYGNSSANYLNGNGGSDTMYGGGGNDYYFVDGGDTVTEYASQGTDTVYSTVSYSLTANVENLSLGGTAYGGYGNELNNTIYGNSSANGLYGYAGSDTIYGYGGNDRINGHAFTSSSLEYDTLSGGTGTDTFVLGGYWGVSYLGSDYATITDWKSSATNDYIEAKGTASQYSLGYANYGGTAALDTQVFYQGDLVAVLRDTTNVNIATDFNFVA